MKSEIKTPNFIRLEEIQIKLAELRGEITQMRKEDKIWEGWLLPCEGGITCVLSTAYETAKEMKKHHNKWKQINKNENS